MTSILIIAGGGFQRFVPALAAIAALRAYHHRDTLVLLTTPDLAGFAAIAPYFNEIWTDDSRGAWDLGRLKRLKNKLRGRTFERVYDLEDSDRSSRVFHLMNGRWVSEKRRRNIFWSGNVPGTRLAFTGARRDAMPVLDRLAAQLKEAGIGDVSRPDVSWAARRVALVPVPFRVTEPFVLIAADHAEGSPWPAERFGALASELAAHGIVPALVGFAVPDAVRAAAVAGTATDLSGQLDASQLIFLAWAAQAAVGPNNGLMHLMAAAGCRSVVLYDATSDPALAGQRGPKITILRRQRLGDIGVAEVLTALQPAAAVRERRGT